MNKLFYPALFHEAEEGGFWITFPDIPECMTQGEDMQQAYEMAVEALGLALVEREEGKERLPEASNPPDIQMDSNSFLVVIEFDMAEYRRKHCSKAINQV